MTSNFTRHNHHIPQKYQLGFADEKSRVHLYDRKRGAYIYGRPKNIGFENDFYTVQTRSGEPTDAVERFLSKVEGKTWPLLDRLTNKGQLSMVERSTVAFFVALMKTRTTAFDRFSRKATDAIAKGMLHLFNPDQETMEERYKEATGTSLPAEQANEMFKALQRHDFAVVPPRQNIIKSMLNIAAELERGLVAMEWNVYSAPGNCKFITNDNPLITIPPPHYDIENRGFGPLTPGVLNAIPINSRAILCMRGGVSRQISFGRATRDFIREINVLLTGASERLVIACDEAQLRKLVSRCRPDEWSNSVEIAPQSPPWLADRFR